MRRILAAAVLVSVAIAPALHAWCELSCADEAETPMPASCHHHADGDGAPSVLDRHDCGSHEAEPAILTKAPRIDVSVMATAAPARHAAASRESRTSVIIANVSPPDTSPPAFISPLRL